jgi:antitoxin component of MazEF toxin-antitoxin module
MKAGMKLTRNGNSTTVCVPRRVLAALRWKAGDYVILEMIDTDTISVHPPRIADLRTAGVSGIIDGSLPAAAK